MKTLLLLFVLTASSFSFAQGIKITDLTGFLTKTSVEEIKKPLEAKGWLFYKKEEEKNDNITWIWTYKYNASTDKAVAWMSVSFEGNTPVRALYEIFDFDLTLPFSSSIYNTDFQFEHIEQDEKEFTKRYANKTYYLWEYQNKEYEKGHQFDCVKKFSNEDYRNGTKKDYYESGSVKNVYELREGKFEGKTTTYYEDGTIKKVSNWKDDKEEGLFQFYNEDGILESDETYENGYLEGPATFYYPSGKIESTYMYSYDKKNGDAKEYDEDGNLTASYQFIGGERFGEYKEYVKGQESFKGFYLSGALSGPYTETLFDEDDRPYATVKGSYKDDYLDGTILAFYLGTKDTLNIRRYKDQKPLGEWRYYDKNKKISKRMTFKDQKADVMKYYTDGELIETITLQKEDNDYWYFQYLYTGSRYSLLANYRVPKEELEPNRQEFTSFESETQIFEVDEIDQSYFKFGLYTTENSAYTYGGNYDDYNMKSGEWVCIYKSSGIKGLETFEDGLLTKEFFMSKKNKPYSGKLTYELNEYKYTIQIKNGFRNGVTEILNTEEKTKYTTNYVDGKVVE